MNLGHECNFCQEDFSSGINTNFLVYTTVCQMKIELESN